MAQKSQFNFVLSKVGKAPQRSRGGEQGRKGEREKGEGRWGERTTSILDHTVVDHAEGFHPDGARIGRLE